MRTLFAILASFLMFGVSCAASPSTLTASNVLSDVERRGARTVAEELYSDKQHWHDFLGGVSSGSPDWLAVAVKLRPVTDAGASNALEIAVFRALGAAPREVLRLMATGALEVQGACNSNFLIDTPIDQGALRMVDDRIAALRNIKDDDLVKTRDFCVQGLRQARVDVLEMINKRDNAAAPKP